MAAEIIQINTQNLESQVYESQDTNLIPTFDVNTSLTSGSYIEYFIYDLNQNILYTEYNFSQYKVLNDGQAAGTGVLSQIEINPEENLIQIGYDQGSYITYYNFLNKKVGSFLEPLYITEISSDRTELRLDSTSLTNFDIVEQTTNFVNERENSEYFLDFYLNFGDNLLYIANNIVLDNKDPNNPTILIKLYESLPTEFNINSTLWVVSSVEEPIAYQVNFIEEPIVFDDTIKIKGPNFNIELKDQVNNSTQELSYVDLVTTSLTSSQNQLNSLLEEKEIDVNIDWTDFKDFTHFSSAQTRLENFYYKVNLIEQYSSSIAILNNTNSSSLAVSQSTSVYESKINEIITNFDGWDYYLYYSSGSWAWPKLNPEPPYQLASTGSALVLNWFGSTNEYSPQYGGIILSASLFDGNNKDNLLFSIPEYLREDSANEPYELFIDMVAQHFDNIWIYYKDVTQKFNADNRLESGISKDIVADAIRDFGIKLYQNNFSNQDLYTAFLGLTPEGSLFPFPNITGSLPTPSGFEYIDTLVSASNDSLPLDDVNKSLYKRIYHNLPYLLKSKGTLPGLRALITSYGIPDTVLRINEYGGKDKVNSNDWDYWQNEFNYSYSTEANNFISSSWTLNNDWNSPNNVPSTLAFRFQTPGLPYSNIRYSQSLWANDSGSAITLTYTGSAYTTGSYSGSIIDPYYQYATLTFYPDITEPTTSSNIYLPFFDGGWWSVMVNRSGSEFTLSTANKIYEGGNNGTTLGFYATSSITGDTVPWINSSTSYFPISFSVGALSGYDVVTYDNTAIYDGTGSFIGNYAPFSGSYQEIRYYNSIINPNIFKDYTMNPYSIEGNSLNSAPNELAFRASVGGEFYTGSVSIHPKVTGSWVVTQSFSTDSNFYYDSTPMFVPNTEYFFFDQPIAGIKNAVSDKIRLENDNIPSGNTLSPFRRLAQTTEASASYTPSINLLEVALSPQDEINDDINSSIGFFNIGNFIGDPAFRSSRLTSYPDLDRLRNEYFEKYTKNYNLVDFIRLIKFFDNSLFKMIRDFIPARTSLASGIVIKQTLLERNRYPEPQANNHTTIAKYGKSGSIMWNEPIIVQDITITGSVKPQWNNFNPSTIENLSGGTAGVFEQFNGIDTSPYGADGNGPDNRFGITQSWNETFPTLSGSVTIVHDSQDEFYNGEFSGSTIVVTTQSLDSTFYKNGENAIPNNAIENRKSSIYQDIDYTQGALVPVNFQLLLSGSATKAAVQDSNYTLKRHTNPRYDGSRTTSQKLNVWSSNDQGTYGKLPTIDSTKTYVAYCNQFSGFTPERNNCSALRILYLIGEDGNVIIPGTSENSLSLNRGTFESGERITIEPQSPVLGMNSFYNVIRGGTSIEPILYNQLSPSQTIPPTFAPSITLTDNNNVGGIIGDYQALLVSSTSAINFIPGTSTWTEVNLNSIISSGSGLSPSSIPLVSPNQYRYEVTQSLVNEGLSLTISAQVYVSNTDGYYNPKSAQTRIVRWRSGNKTILATTPSKLITTDYTLIFVSITLPFDQILTSDQYALEAAANRPNTYIEANSGLVFNQSPVSNSTIPIAGLWISASGTESTQIQNNGFSSPYLIYTTASALVNYFNNPTVYQQNIPSSGFNNITLPWSLKYGDEFRFEGREDRLYTISQAGRLSGSFAGGSNVSILAVQLDRPVPSSGSVNFDQFSIRRYVNDNNLILIEGFRPAGSSGDGPWLVKPEFVTPALNKNIDEFIVDLTQKGLL